MSGSNPHDKIIKRICKEVLLPVGVFQRGSSRLYIDDNGYFFTVIEFQPSSWSKGTYLNIALHFLWNKNDFITFDFPLGGKSRVKGFVEYNNDAQFEQAIRLYAELALEHVLFYRTLRDIITAKEYAQKWTSEYPINPYVKELDKMNILDNKDMLQRIKRTRSFWHAKPAMKKMPYHIIYDEQTSS